MSTESFVEANSLSGLTQLAANPPKYPRNPTERERASLVLYLARVPGSKDIILTTLKPQLKNVTSEDVASSLYYLHLNSDDDAELVPETQPIPTREASRASRLPRKPLPEGYRAKPLDLDRQSIIASGLAHPQAPALDVYQEDASEPSVTLQTGDNATEMRGLAKPSIGRLPVGSQTPMRANTINRKPLPNAAPRGPTSKAESAQMSQTTAGVVAASRGLQGIHDLFDSHQTTGDTGKAFSITIIRRDPTSGGQWNIGTVEGKSNPPSEKAAPFRKPYYDISVHITTPGYGYFRHPLATSQLKRSGTTISHESRGTNTQYPRDEGSAPVTPKTVSSGTGFHRQVSMEWANSWNETFKKHRRAISDFSARHSRSSSGSSNEPQVSESDTQMTEGSRNSRAKGYTFLSPWGGTCRFSTGGAGRSLRCRHKLPAPVSADTLGASSSSICVSELRFNLPGADLFDASKMNAAAIQVKNGSSTISRKLDNARKRLSASKPQPSTADHPHADQPHTGPRPTMYPDDDETGTTLPPRPSSISSSYGDQSPPVAEQLHDFLDELATTRENEDRLDLTIGQEKAGGGNRGKRAKLGKLIIHDEGLKMMDLIVAANIGVWWTIWDPN